MVCCEFIGWCSLKPEQQAAWITVLITTVYTVVTVLLWLKNGETIRLTKELFTTLNNPYIGYDGARIIEKDGSPFMEIHFSNYGKVPVNDIRLLASWGSKLEEVKNHKIRELLPRSVAFPGQNLYQPEPFDKEDYKLLKNNKSVSLFLRVELYCIDLEGKNYVHYFLGTYQRENNNFQVLESFAGHIEKCPYNITDKQKQKKE